MPEDPAEDIILPTHIQVLEGLFVLGRQTIDKNPDQFPEGFQQLAIISVGTSPIGVGLMPILVISKEIAGVSFIPLDDVERFAAGLLNTKAAMLAAQAETESPTSPE